ncbi:hypothetical protein [Vibrio algivorus]|uniref:Uncharacterized protein n=1 Tax=Vibrio algivorus TaxID=1667024 RepID=A0ABQ6ERQ1_9VIBR|nr:hypothetical protein [Vibrio algivorus]GLT15300.1 hypothetical protein GCM10007931_22750 [Vibrio algivorus]
MISSPGIAPLTIGGGGTLKDYFIEESILWISDKEYIKGDNSRLIILPSIAIDILKQYIQYLENLNKNSVPEQHNTKTKIKSILDGDEHLFFFFTHVDQLESFKPKYIWNVQMPLGEVKLLQANWGKHQIKTYLHTYGIPTEYIAAWMGHSLGKLLLHGHFRSLSNDGPQLIVKTLLPFFIIIFGVLMLVIYIPEISMSLPQLMGLIK